MKRKDFLSFKGDISRGQLNHADPVELWDGIINSISDEDLLAAKNILVVASGRCTEAIIIRDRLMKLGINKEEVNARMTLVENDFWLAGLAEKKGFNVVEDNFIQWAKGTTMKFDIIVGNPPYQDSSTKRKSSPLWMEFTKLSIGLLKPNGYLGWVIPKTWLSPNKSYELLSPKKFIYVNLDVDRHFRVGCSISAFLLKNEIGNGEIEFITETESKIKVNVQDYGFLPSKINDVSLSLVKKFFFGSHVRLPVLLDSSTSVHPYATNIKTSAEKTDECKYKLFHTNAQTVYGSVKNKNHHQPKVMMTMSGYQYPIYSDDCSTSQIVPFILVADECEGKKMVSLLSSKLFQGMMNICKYSGFALIKVLRQLPSVPLTHEYTDQELYELFGLTDEEIAYVESHVK